MTSLELLKKVCDLYGQRKVAKTINRSATTVNQTLKGTYPKPEPILEMIELAFSSLRSTSINCPILGEIHPKTCFKYKQWATEGRVHPDYLYREVKKHCVVCEIGEKQ